MVLVNCAQDVKQTSRTRKPHLWPVRSHELVYWPDIKGMCGPGWVFRSKWPFQMCRMTAEYNETIGLDRGLSWLAIKLKSVQKVAGTIPCAARSSVKSMVSVGYGTRSVPATLKN